MGIDKEWGQHPRFDNRKRRDEQDEETTPASMHAVFQARYRAHQRPLLKEYQRSGRNRQRLGFDHAGWVRLDQAVTALQEERKDARIQHVAHGLRALAERLGTVHASLWEALEAQTPSDTLRVVAQALNDTVESLTVASVGLSDVGNLFEARAWVGLGAIVEEQLLQDAGRLLLANPGQVPDSDIRKNERMVQAWASAPTALHAKMALIQEAAIKRGQAAAEEELSVRMLLTHQAANAASDRVAEMQLLAILRHDPLGELSAAVDPVGRLSGLVMEGRRMLEAIESTLKSLRDEIKLPKKSRVGQAGAKVMSAATDVRALAAEFPTSLAQANAMSADAFVLMGRGFAQTRKEAQTWLHRADDVMSLAGTKVLKTLGSVSRLPSRVGLPFARRDKAVTAALKSMPQTLLADTQRVLVVAQWLIEPVKNIQAAQDAFVRAQRAAARSRRVQSASTATPVTAPAETPSSPELMAIATILERHREPVTRAERRAQKAHARQDEILAAHASLEQTTRFVGQIAQSVVDSARQEALSMGKAEASGAAPEAQRAEANAQQAGLAQALEREAEKLQSAAQYLADAVHHADKGEWAAALERATDALDAARQVKGRIKVATQRYAGESVNHYSRGGMLAKAIGQWIHEEKQAYRNEHPDASMGDVDRAMEQLSAEIARDLATEKDPEGALLTKRIENAVRDAQKGGVLWPATAEQMLAGSKSIDQYLAEWGTKKVGANLALGYFSWVAGQGDAMLNTMMSMAPVRKLTRLHFGWLKIALAPFLIPLGVRALKRSVRPGQDYPHAAIKQYVQREIFKLIFRLFTYILPPAADRVLAVGLFGYGVYRGLAGNDPDRWAFVTGYAKPATGLATDVGWGAGLTTYRDVQIEKLKAQRAALFSSLTQMSEDAAEARGISERPIAHPVNTAPQGERPAGMEQPSTDLGERGQRTGRVKRSVGSRLSQTDLAFIQMMEAEYGIRKDSRVFTSMHHSKGTMQHTLLSLLLDFKPAEEVISDATGFSTEKSDAILGKVIDYLYLRAKININDFWSKVDPRTKQAMEADFSKAMDLLFDASEASSNPVLDINAWIDQYIDGIAARTGASGLGLRADMPVKVYVSVATLDLVKNPTGIIVPRAEVPGGPYTVRDILMRRHVRDSGFYENQMSIVFPEEIPKETTDAIIEADMQVDYLRELRAQMSNPDIRNKVFQLFEFLRQSAVTRYSEANLEEVSPRQSAARNYIASGENPHLVYVGNEVVPGLLFIPYEEASSKRNRYNEIEREYNGTIISLHDDRHYEIRANNYSIAVENREDLGEFMRRHLPLGRQASFASVMNSDGKTGYNVRGGRSRASQKGLDNQPILWFKESENVTEALTSAHIQSLDANMDYLVKSKGESRADFAAGIIDAMGTLLAAATAPITFGSSSVVSAAYGSFKTQVLLTFFSSTLPGLIRADLADRPDDRRRAVCDALISIANEMLGDLIGRYVPGMLEMTGRYAKGRGAAFVEVLPENVKRSFSHIFKERFAKRHPEIVPDDVLDVGSYIDEIYKLFTEWLPSTTFFGYMTTVGKSVIGDLLMDFPSDDEAKPAAVSS
ncbi:hypothetical protein FPJ27_15250 [Burkholderia sp. MS455]|uniref:hypothetical protein n=1 Tax=Burkholderia sp. MS455 TaxID=2811788 RepID=UPI00195ACF73|nr:hypothetical protein [Burkholderia sp. MS455]QRR07623.1 hypothetical protein FPJ27_15250 [Burkholderia sp. MS455]